MENRHVQILTENTDVRLLAKYQKYMRKYYTREHMPFEV